MEESFPDTGGRSERASLLPSHAGRSNGHAGNGVTYQSGGSQPMPIKAANGDHLPRPVGKQPNGHGVGSLLSASFEGRFAKALGSLNGRGYHPIPDPEAGRPHPIDDEDFPDAGPHFKLRDEVPISGLQQSIVEHQFSGAWVSQALVYGSVLDLLPETPMPAVRSVDGREATTHHQLRSFLAHSFDLAKFGLKRGDRVGVVLPNGPEAGVCLVAVSTYATCAPINNNLQAEEIRFELGNLRCRGVIVPDLDGAEALPPAIMTMLSELKDMKVIALVPDTKHAGLFSLHGQEVPLSLRPAREPNGPQDVALVLHTSGTSGTKKIVPYPLHNIMVGACVVLASWALRPSDCNLNMMPLFHIGGIARNLFAPILSGGSTVLCKGFDAALFLDVLETTGATWYYAAPTMHQLILQEWARRDSPPYNHNIRMIANAAGGLLPALARELRDTFNQATVLPSYGMTECMPISSPPVDYKLDRPGTSGLAVGPELAILDDKGSELPRGRVGNICVRGAPLMPGYENNEAANLESFFSNGFFCTGDMGFMDHEGYLFITGRSKEVINRGGEIVSPFDVEEAVISHPRVKECLAFSTAHNVLQETVGLVVVPQPDQPRPDIKELQRHVSRSLHPSKWPMLVVYMDTTPKNMTNKALRINLGTRLGLPELFDDTPLRSRLYEAKAPPRSASLQQPIPCHRAALDFQETSRVLRSLPGVTDLHLATTGDLAGDAGSVSAFVCPSSLSSEELLAQAAQAGLHDYLLPDKVYVLESIPRDAQGQVDEAALLQAKASHSQVKPPRTPLQHKIHGLYQQVLATKESLPVDASFFELGGDSMKAGALSSLLRKNLDVTIPISTLYTHPTIELLSEAIQTASAAGDSTGSPTSGGHGSSAAYPSPRTRMVREVVDDNRPVPNCSSTSLLALLVQLLPLTVFYPAVRMAFFFIFVKSVVLMPWSVHGHGITSSEMTLYVLVLTTVLKALGVALAFDAMVLPFIGILLKWLIIGRYRQGRYPLWGQYYLRWWLTKQCLDMTGRGFFAWHPSLLNWYYRLLGARIGSDVKIHNKARLSEYDLVSLASHCRLDVCSVRPMAFDKGNMVLKPVTVMDHVSVCCHSTVASGTTLKAATSLSPNSSSWEVSDNTQAFREYNRQNFPAPSLWLQCVVGYPVLLVTRLLTVSPRFAMLFALVYFYPTFLAESGHSVAAFLSWFSSRTRLWYYISVKLVRVLVTPFVGMACLIATKWLVVGRFKEGLRGDWQNLQYWLVKAMLGFGSFHRVASMVGTHYECISVIYRLLGAKIGKRVYWPGSGLDLVEFDLLEIGDDVIFGSRSTFLAGDSRENKRIKIDAGSMVADRCVLLPGVTVRRHAVLGSGGIAPKNFTFPPASTHIGSSNGLATLWSSGDEKGAASLPTSTPFGRAFYQHKAPFYVMRLWQHVALNVGMKALSAVYWALPILAAFRVALLLQARCPYLPPNALETAWAFPMLVASFSLTSSLASVLALVLTISFKWMVMGHRRPGTYRWDESTYCQRWQVYIALEGLRRTGGGRDRVLHFFHGTPFLVWYFRMLGAKIGKNVCLYPNGADPMMTEPDLVTLGDHVCVDDASLIAHINTKGDFKLNRLHVESGGILRSGSRLLSGAAMDRCSTLLEHTLIVAGETTDPCTVWQGWPGKLVSKTSHSWGEPRGNKKNKVLVVEQAGLMAGYTSSTSKHSKYGAVASAGDWTVHSIQV